MELSEATIQLLKNFASINSNIVIKQGNVLKTISEAKNVLASAVMLEDMPKDFGIYDLNQFLNVLGLVDVPRLKFEDNFVTIGDSTGRTTIQYFYSDMDMLTSPSKDITMPSEEITFTLTDAMLSKLSKSAGMIGAPDLLLENNKLTVRDKKNDSGNCYSTNVDAKGDGTYKFYFKTENLKLIPGSYDVTVSQKNISHFKNGKTQYWIALEPESSYSA